MHQQFSEIEGCSPRSTCSQASDFFLLLEAEMAQAAQRFTQDLVRIERGHQDSAQIGKLFQQLEESKSRIAELESTLATVAEDRNQFEMIVQQLVAENKGLKEQLQIQREEAVKVQLEDKYRRALVYIDTLQSKLSTSVPLRSARASRHTS